jgi:hypothetical protein
MCFRSTTISEFRKFCKQFPKVFLPPLRVVVVSCIIDCLLIRTFPPILRSFIFLLISKSWFKKPPELIWHPHYKSNRHSVKLTPIFILVNLSILWNFMRMFWLLLNLFVWQILDDVQRLFSIVSASIDLSIPWKFRVKMDN